MKAEHDIEKQLADAQGAWDSTPPTALWERLEDRLDAAMPMATPRKPKNWPFRIVLVLLPLGFLLWQLWPSATASTVKAQPLALRTQEVVLPIAAIVHPAPLTASEPDIAQLELRQAEIQTLFPSGNLQPVVVLAPSSNVGAQSALNFSSVQTNTFNYDLNPSNGNLYANGNDLLNYTLPLGNMLVTNGLGNPIDTVSSLLQYSTTIQGVDNNRYLQINPSRNDMNFNFVGPAPVDNAQNLQHLKWLLGSWKSQGTSGGTIEEWRQKDEFTLVGRGYFVVNGDTMITQEMRIEQRGPNVYYIIAKDEHAKAMKFRLRSRMNNELIFQNESKSSNEELVLRNHPATNEAEKIITSPTENNDAGPVGNTSTQLAPPKVYHVLKRK